jgi:hypothetical protein
MNIGKSLLQVPILFVAVCAASGQIPARMAPTSTPTAASAATVVPALVPYSGIAMGDDGKPLAGETGVTFLIYKDEQGGEPLWVETQTVAFDSSGRYKVQLGATSSNGLPSDLFVTGEARWLEVQIAGQNPQPRLLLASVPYALKAADASSLGGLPASAYALAGPSSKAAATAGIVSDAASTVTTTGGTAGYVPEFSGAATIVDSPVFILGADVGIGTTTPTATLDVNGAALISGALTANGGATVGGSLVLPALATATASGGFDSQVLKMYTSAYNSSTKATVDPRFEWEAVETGNNTASPTATLELLASNGPAGATGTGFSFNSNGIINFAPGQTFPATSSTGTAVDGSSTSGIGVEGNSNSNIGVSGASQTNTGVEGFSAGGSNTAGVYGESGSGSGMGAGTIAGVWGDAYNHVGVAGTSKLFPGVSGLSVSNSGVVGTSQTPVEGTAGMFGTTGKARSNTYGTESPSQVAGAWGDTTGNPTSGDYAAGVIGTADNADGGTFFNNSSSFATIYAENLAVGDGLGAGVGVSGIGGIGIQGSGTTTGVMGTTLFADIGAGVYGVHGSPSVEGQTLGGFAGVWADTSQNLFALLATADTGAAAGIYNDAPDSQTLIVENDTQSNNSAVILQTFGHVGNCTINVSGDLSCDGKVTTVASVDQGARKVETYSVQSAENWFEDAGTGQLQGGAAHVSLEPLFGQTVNTGVEYHVFLTPDGDCKGLYVSAKSGGGFEVRELGGGNSSIAFEYRIMAKRAGYENVRLVDVTDKLKRQADQRERMRHPAGTRAPVHPVTLRPPMPGGLFPQKQVLTPSPQSPVTTPAAKAELR